jgi:signal peptidase I
MFLNLIGELLQTGYGVRFGARGHSMHPTIRDGEALMVEPVAAGDVRRGDILLYSTRRGAIAHRVIRVRAEGSAERAFVLRGDASMSSVMDEEVVSARYVLGRVVSVERNGREIDLTGRGAKLRQAARARVARLLCALLPARRTETI